MPYLVLLAAIAFAVSPFLSPEFGGFAADRFPIPQSDPPVQPAGYAFSIWGVIYVWLILGAAYGVWARRDHDDWQPMRLPLLVSMAVGVAWLPVAVSSPLWATGLIWIMWGGAVLALIRTPYRDRWVARAPIGLYAGWLTAAPCVSVGMLLAGYGWLEEVPAALVALGLALALSAAVMAARPDAPGFPVAVIWALIAVVVANIDGSVMVLGLAALGAALLAVLAVRNRLYAY